MLQQCILNLSICKLKFAYATRILSMSAKMSCQGLNSCLLCRPRTEEYEQPERWLMETISSRVASRVTSLLNDPQYRRRKIKSAASKPPYRRHVRTAQNANSTTAGRQSPSTHIRHTVNGSVNAHGRRDNVDVSHRRQLTFTAASSSFQPSALEATASGSQYLRHEPSARNVVPTPGRGALPVADDDSKQWLLLLTPPAPDP